MSGYQYSNEVVQSVLQVIEELNELQDIDTILDRILFEARRLTQADGATLFLIENSKLVFKCVQNDTLFQEPGYRAENYKHYSLPIDLDSFVGYTATTGQTVVVDDVYNLPPYLTCSFNSSFDQQTGYRTRSLFTIPLKTTADRLVGVLQLINAKDDEGRPASFNRESRLYMPLLSNHAAMSITRGIFNRQLILRMMKMAELRDPSETGRHVQRVGAYSAEIYEHIAKKRNTPSAKIKYQKNVIRLAAMLHDVGKVGISDTLLKKPAKLSPEEFNIVKMHTIYGFDLFGNITSDIDHTSREIALNHHERWDGTGYPSTMPQNRPTGTTQKTGRKGKEIPLSARITALADVYDALTNKRCYKDAFGHERALKIILEGSGSHFDPEVVEAFVEITDIIKAIQNKYLEESPLMEEQQSAMFVQTKNFQLENLVGTHHELIYAEIGKILKTMSSLSDFPLIPTAYHDTVALFEGRYPGYQACTSPFRTLNHTMAVALAVVRLLHGCWVNDISFSAHHVERVLICALFANAGFIPKTQATSHASPPHSAPLAASHTFIRQWLLSKDQGKLYDEDWISILECTNQERSPLMLPFSSPELQRLGYILGSADILAQMADRMYLEKIPLLAQERHTAASLEKEMPKDVFQQTEHFFNTVITERLFSQFDNITKNMRSHFKHYRNMDSDPYLESITGQIQHIRFLNIKCQGNSPTILAHLRRRE